MVSDDVRAQLEELIKKNKVLLFMKGNKHFPQCGFSSRVVSILKETGAKFVPVKKAGNLRLMNGRGAEGHPAPVPHCGVSLDQRRLDGRRTRRKRFGTCPSPTSSASTSTSS
jgi:hypothetical protein